MAGCKRKQSSDISLQSEENPDEIDFTKPWNVSDVSFLVEEKKVYACKAILSMWSPVMNAMFFHGFREQGNTDIDLPGKKYEEILELVKVIHPPGKPVDGKSVSTLLSLAREYQMTTLTKRCEEFLLGKSPSLTVLVLADEYSLTALRKTCLKYVNTRSFNQLKNEYGFDRLDKDTKMQILLDKAQRQQSTIDAQRYEIGVQKSTIAAQNATDKRLQTISKIAFGRSAINADCPQNNGHWLGSSTRCQRCCLNITARIQDELKKKD